MNNFESPRTIIITNVATSVVLAVATFVNFTSSNNTDAIFIIVILTLFISIIAIIRHFFSLNAQSKIKNIVCGFLVIAYVIAAVVLIAFKDVLVADSGYIYIRGTYDSFLNIDRGLFSVNLFVWLSCILPVVPSFIAISIGLSRKKMREHNTN